MRALICFVLLMFFKIAVPVGQAAAFPLSENASEPDSLSLAIQDFLNDYYQVVNELIAGTGEDAGRVLLVDFFANPNVQVFPDGPSHQESDPIRAEQYIQYLTSLRPENVRFMLTNNSLRISKPESDFGSRYRIRVIISRQMLSGSGADMSSPVKKLAFILSYSGTDHNSFGFRIRGIEVVYDPPKLIRFQAGITNNRMYTKPLLSDDRFKVLWRPGMDYSIMLENYFNDNLALTTGLGWSLTQGGLSLDRFDPFQGFDPHMENIRYAYTLYSASLPVLMVWKLNQGKKHAIQLYAGLVAGYQYFETYQTSALRTGTETSLSGIISDNEWLNQLTRWGLHSQIDLSVSWQVKQGLFADLYIGFNQRLTSIEKYSVSAYPSGRYTGQFHSLWADGQNPTLLQQLRLGFGLAYTLNQKR